MELLKRIFLLIMIFLTISGTAAAQDFTKRKMHFRRVILKRRQGITWPPHHPLKRCMMRIPMRLT